MERTTWTDERLADFQRVVETRFDRVDADIRDLRVTLIRALTVATGAIMTGLLAVIATLIAQG